MPELLRMASGQKALAAFCRVVKSSELIFTLTWTVRFPLVSISSLSLRRYSFCSNDTVGTVSTNFVRGDQTMKPLLAISLVILSSLAYGQTSTATAPDANKLVYRGAPAWNLSSNKTGVTIMYVDGTSERLPWSSLITVAIHGEGEDRDISACTGTTTTLDRPLKASILVIFDTAGTGNIRDGKRMCIPFTGKDAPAAQQ
jgi:hypothetical protein